MMRHIYDMNTPLNNAFLSLSTTTVLYAPITFALPLSVTIIITSVRSNLTKGRIAVAKTIPNVNCRPVGTLVGSRDKNSSHPLKTALPAGNLDPV